MREKERKEMQQILAELQMNHNHTWYEELYQRNKSWLNDTALFYRGNNISYDSMFKNMRRYAKALLAFGITNGSEVPVCMSNTPEFVYLLGAISMIGAKINSFGAEFDKEYITEIIDDCNCGVIFCEDYIYAEIYEAINSSRVKQIVMSSLTNSLPDGKNPYELYDKKHGRICDRVSEYIKQNDKIVSIESFVATRQDYTGNLLAQCGLDTDFIVSYTSGSTNSVRPKAIVHTTRSLVTIGRCHDPEVQKTTSMKDFTIQALIPTHSNTDIIASISDSLMQGACLALEPIYDKDFFIDTLLINRPNYAVAPRSFWVHMAKQVYFLKEYKNTKFPFLLLAFAVGEPLEINEESFINKVLRKAKAGTEKIPLPFSIMSLSAAGGDCEHGGIFYTLFRQVQNKKPSNLFRRQEQGLMPFSMVDVAVLDDDGKTCKPYQLGRLVVNSPCNMKEYKNNPEATADFFIKDASGKTWGDCKVYAYMDKWGGIHMKGRISDKKQSSIHPFQIAEVILRDRKNILSCEVVEIENTYIAHVEFQPERKQDYKLTLSKAQKRCQKVFGNKIANQMYWRMRSNKESFPLTGCGKRDTKLLVKEGVSSKCLKLVE